MNAEKQICISRLQDNLAAIRRIAGWTAEQLGERIGVTKQTISNLENKKTPMTLTQYIAIRAVLDYEIKNNPNNLVLPQVVDILLDKSEELNDGDYKQACDAVSAVSLSAAGGVAGATLATLLAGALGPVGLASSIAVSATGFLTGGMTDWIRKIVDNEKK